MKMWGKFHLQNQENENLAIEVAPSTLGECTSLRDKNGKLIFEGDIIVWDYDELDIDGSTHTMPQAVVWNKRLCGFVIEKDDNIDENCRVIGNIHDNLEIISERTN